MTNWTALHSKKPTSHNSLTYDPIRIDISEDRYLTPEDIFIIIRSHSGSSQAISLSLISSLHLLSLARCALRGWLE